MASTSGLERGKWLLVVLLAGQFMANIDTAIVNTAGPSIKSSLGASDGQVDLVVSGYIVAHAVLLVTGARLGGTYGYQRVFLWGLAGFTVTSLMCGLAQGPEQLIVARLLQGSAGALMVPQVLSGIQLHFQGPARRRALGLFAVSLSGGAITGQVLGGLLIHADLLGSGWRSIFLINLPIGAVLLLAGLRVLPRETPKERRPLDGRGVGLLTIALLLSIGPLVLGRELGWPAWIWVCVLCAAAAAIWFVRTEKRLATSGGHPLVNLRMAAFPPLRWALAAHGLTSASYLALLFVLAHYLQEGLDRSPAYSGMVMVPWVAAFGVGGLLAGRVPERLVRYVPAGSCSLLAVSYIAVALTVWSGPGDGPLLLAALALGGLGLGLSSNALIGHMTEAVDSRWATDLSGVITTNGQLAGAAGVAAFGSLYASWAPAGDRAGAVDAFAGTAALFAVLALLGACAALSATRALARLGPFAPAGDPLVRDPDSTRAQS
ncbi:MFS transporter [Streptomyces yaizuensis]|uniref:MFS transporter n=1 Tax=Streptomyces yaizuensis TaxID=2989713 RepID=A0ABQ5P5J5_9ACTN|nr:MFS transporter [Streptomyces sp. YSPA8]GLF97760.1 MFS transporter [Streptomyces sp. YSPA8]